MSKAKIPSNMFTVAPGVWGRKDVFVNFYIIQSSESNDWILVDTGLKWSACHIKEMAAYFFGSQSKPKAIILTHGHFDHVGAVDKLANEWKVPVYAHELEVPYLTDQSSYPPPDPTVGGGLMATLSFLYPSSPINIRKHLKKLPPDGLIPVLPDWTYIHTPGHSPGHISLFRKSDRTLIAGDAFVTTKQESATSVIFQTKHISGPPKYFTCDWEAAQTSIEKLVSLNPEAAATGHGKPMRNGELLKALSELTKNFSKKSIPSHGRYIPNPAITNSHGVMYIPPKKSATKEKALQAFGVTALLTFFIVFTSYKKQKKRLENEALLDIEYNY